MTTNSAALLEEMLAQASPIPEMGGMAKNDVIHPGDINLPSPMIVNEMASAGYYWVYDLKTGQPSLCNGNMLRDVLSRRDERGGLIWTADKGRVPEWKAGGGIRCMLHADSPLRSEYDEMGFPVCAKSNIPSAFQLRRHMETRHAREWQAIEEDRLRKERDEDRAYQRSLVELARAQTAAETTHRTHKA